MTGIGITPKMVKVTIKRADDSPDSEKWVCERVDDDSELEPTEEMADEPSGSLPVDDQNLNEESEDSEEWYSKIPSYLEIEMKEDKTPEPSSGISNDNTTILETQQNHGTADSPGNSCSRPMNLSISYSKHISKKNVTNNASNKSPIREHSTKSKFLQNAYDDFCITASLTGSDRIIQDEAAPYFPRSVGSQNTSLTSDQRQVNSEEVVAMAMRTMPSTSQNFAMTIQKNSPITSGLVNLEKPEIVTKGNIPNHIQEQALRLQMANYWNYVRNLNIALYSNANRSYNWPLIPENNAEVLPIRNECAERIGENLAENLLQKSTNNYKRLSQTCTQIGSNDAHETILPPKRKKEAPAEVPGTIHHCNVCDATFKTDNGYKKHILTEKHLRRVNQSDQQQPSLNNFQPNSVSRPLVSDIQPQPHLHDLMGNRMQYHQMSQAHVKTAEKQYVGGGTIMSNNDVQKSHPGTSNFDCSDEFLDHNRLQNDLETKFYAQDPKYMNQPVNQSSNPQDNFLHPRHPHSKNSMVNPRYLGNKAPHSTQDHNDPSLQIQPENSRTGRSMDKPDSCAMKPNQLEKLTGVSFSQKSGSVQLAPPHQLEFFRVFHCLVCSRFHSNDLQKLERHISIIRNKTPFDLITTLNKNLYCKICQFETKTSVEMVQHCNSRIHVDRVDYYNHVMEGGIQVREKLKNVHAFSPIFLFCAACDFSTTSLDTLKAHNYELSHLNNALCCLYLSKFSPAVEYCYCRPCDVKTPTKKELVLHVRSRKHLDTLLQNPSNSKRFSDPVYLYFIKELSLNIKEAPRVSEQTKGSLFAEREELHLRKENNEKNVNTENPTPLDLSSSASLKPLPVSCPLCQKVFPEVNVLLQHLQQIHGVNEEGVKWVMSQITKVHEEKSLPTEEQRNIDVGKPKGIVFVPERSFAADNTLSIQGMSTDSFSYQNTVAAGQIIESKSSKCLKVVTSLQNLTNDENLNEKRRTDTNVSANQFDKTKLVQNPDKLDRNLEERTGKDFFLSQQLSKVERLQNQGTSSIYSFESQQFYEKRGMPNSDEPDQKPDFDQERVNMGPHSSQQFHKTENTPPVEEKNLNSSSSPAEVIVESESEPNGDSKYDTVTDYSSSRHFSAIGKGLPIQQSSLSAGRKRNDPSSRENNTPSKRQFCKTENMLSLGEEKLLNSEENLNSSSSQADAKVIVEYESELNRGKIETETDNYLRENFSASERGSPIPLPDHNVSRERNGSSSSEIDSLTPERLLAVYDSSIAHSSPQSQLDLNANRKLYDSSSSERNSALRGNFPSYENRSQEPLSGRNASREKEDSSLNDHQSATQQRSPSTDYSAREHDFLKSQSDHKARRKEKDSSSSNEISTEYEWLTVRAERSRVNSSPNQHYLLESENRSSYLEGQEMSNLRENVVNDSPINRLMAIAEFKQVDNISVMNKNSDESMNAQNVLYKCPNEYEAEFSALNFPTAFDLQRQERKSIGNIEISNVISLASSVENDNNTEEEENDLDFEGIVFSDLEEL